MAAKKDKNGIDSLRTDVQALADAFWKFRDTMLTEVAVHQAEEQVAQAEGTDGSWATPDDAKLQRAAATMSALSQPQRLRIVLLLADGPTSVSALVEALGLKTTGAAYHHLNVLINNGIAVQPERGTFAISPDASAQVNALMVAMFGSAPASDDGGKKKK